MKMEFTVNQLRQLQIDLETWRRNLLAELETDGADPVAECHYNIAINLVDQARQQLKLAQLAQSRALAGRSAMTHMRLGDGSRI